MRSHLTALLGARLQLGLSPHGLVLQHQASAWQRPAEVARLAWAADPGADAMRLAELCAPLLGQGRGAGHFAGLPLAVTLSDELVRLFMVSPPPNATRLQDLQAAAGMRFQALYGDAAHEWQLVIEGHLRAPFLACAMPQARLAALQALAKANRLCLVAVVPQFASVWNQARAQLGKAWLGVAQGQLLTLGTPGKGPRLAGVHRLIVPLQGGDGGWLREQLGRVALRAGLALPTELQLFGHPDRRWLAPGACEEVPVVSPTLPGLVPLPQAGAQAPVATAARAAQRLAALVQGVTAK